MGEASGSRLGVEGYGAKAGDFGCRDLVDVGYHGTPPHSPPEAQNPKLATRNPNLKTEGPEDP